MYAILLGLENLPGTLVMCVGGGEEEEGVKCGEDWEEVVFVARRMGHVAGRGKKVQEAKTASDVASRAGGGGEGGQADCQ